MINFNFIIEELPNGQLKFVVSMPEGQNTDKELCAAQDVRKLITDFFEFQRRAQSGADRKDFSMSELVRGFGGKNLANEFDVFIEKAYHDIPIGLGQLTECRKAFYAGAAICFLFMRRTAELDENSAMREMGDWEKEIKLFFTSYRLSES